MHYEKICQKRVHFCKRVKILEGLFNHFYDEGSLLSCVIVVNLIHSQFLLNIIFLYLIKKLTALATFDGNIELIKVLPTIHLLCKYNVNLYCWRKSEFVTFLDVRKQKGFSGLKYMRTTFSYRLPLYVKTSCCIEVMNRFFLTFSKL